MIDPRTKEEIHVKCPNCHLTAFIIKPLTDPPQKLNAKISHKCRKCGTIFEFPSGSVNETRQMINE